MNYELLTYLESALRNDEVLQSLFPNDHVAVRYRTQRPEKKFPYMTHTYSSRNVENWGLVSSSWRVHIWDYGDNNFRHMKIHDRIKTLFDRNYYVKGVEGITGLRIWWSGSSFPDEKEHLVWHAVCQFGIRYIDQAHIEEVACNRPSDLLS